MPTLHFPDHLRTWTPLFFYVCSFLSPNQKCRSVVKGRAKGWDERGGKAFQIGKEGEGCYCILSIKDNTRFYIQPGLSVQSTGLECMKDHMRSLCVCSEATKQFFVCFCVYKCAACVTGLCPSNDDILETASVSLNCCFSIHSKLLFLITKSRCSLKNVSRVYSFENVSLAIWY